MRYPLLLVSCAISTVTLGASRLPTADRYNPVPLTQVRLTDDFWRPRISMIEHKTIAYALNKCEAEGRFDNFLIAGGQMQGTTRGEMPFDDTDVYKIVEGASYCLLIEPNPALKKRLDEIIKIIAVGQEPDGYLTTWRTINPMKPPAPWVKPGPRWHDLGLSHELYNAGHLFDAAAAHYAATGKTTMLNIATRYADLLVKTFGPGKLEAVPGHEIVEDGLVKLYRITGRRDYLELAKYFLDHRGDPANHQLYGPYSQDHIPVIQQREAVGHAVRAVYLYAGMTDMAELYHNDDYFNAVTAIWHNMVGRKLYLTGGIGSHHDGEAFGEDYELPNLTAYAETCASIGSVMWNDQLYQITGDAACYDVIERTLYNALIDGLSLDGTHFFYANCLAADRKFAFNRGHHTRAEWFDCSCCPTNLIRFLPSLPGLLYAQQHDTVAVNLYIASDAKLTVAGQPLQLKQTTNYPWDGDIRLDVSPVHPATFTLKLRMPGWVRNQPVPDNLYHYLGEPPAQPFTLSLNGQPVDTKVVDGYLSIHREWAPGDQLQLTFVMPIREVVARPEVANLKGKVALERGPLVYCLEENDNATPVADIALGADPHLQAEPREMLNGLTVIEGQTADGKPFTAIPYYAWSNRGVSAMTVWMPKKE